ncbi:hypothetical protein C0431_14665 [bacterium]|nr:hypothetical protein [bacterium]
MKTRGLISRQVGSYGAAAVLSVLTLAVFAYSKDTGPESTVRRYHQSIIDGEISDLSKVTIGTDGAQEQLRLIVTGALRQSEGVTLGRVRQDGREAYADVVYVLPGGRGMTTLRFMVRKPNLKWKIDSEGTLRLLSRMNQFE